MLKQLLFKHIYAVIALLVVFCIYIVTMMPSQAFHDAGEFQTIVYTMDIAHPTGFPTFVLLGKLLISLIPFGEVAWKVNFLSIVYSLGALVFAYLFLNILTKDRVFPLIGVLTLAFCKPFWYYSGIADPHTLNRLFLFLLLFLFIKLSLKWNNKIWFLFSVLLGLGLGNHLLLIYSIPGFILGILILILRYKINDFRLFIVLGLLGLISGLSVYLFLPIRQMFGPTLVKGNLSDLNILFNHVTGASFRPLMYQGGFSEIVLNMWVGLKELMNIISLIGVVIGVMGILYGLKFQRAVTLGLLLMFLSFLVFSTNYPTSDETRYYLTYIGIFCLFIGMGSAAVIYLLTSIFKLTSLLNYFVFAVLLIYPTTLFLINYKLVDKSQRFEALAYSKSIFEDVVPNSVIISWWNYSTPLWYRQQVLAERPDILIINDSQYNWVFDVEKYIKRRSVYVVEPEPSVEKYFQLERRGNVYQVIQKN